MVGGAFPVARCAARCGMPSLGTLYRSTAKRLLTLCSLDFPADKVEISFEPALLGMFVLTLYEGRGLGENDPASRPNPYVVATLGEM